MFGKLFSNFFSSEAKEAPALPAHAAEDLRAVLRNYRVSIPATAVQKVLDAVRRKRMIEAIKEVRESAEPSVGLKEAKEIVEAFARRLKDGGDRFGR